MGDIKKDLMTLRYRHDNMISCHRNINMLPTWTRRLKIVKG